MADLADLTATELMAEYASGTASPTDAVRSCLDRIDDVDDEINAILTLLADEALVKAQESTTRWLRGDVRPMEGVPYGLKDIIATADVLTTGGSALYQDWVPTRSAVLADRLSAAGGILLAKLQTFEFASGGAASKTFVRSITPGTWPVRREARRPAPGPQSPRAWCRLRSAPIPAGRSGFPRPTAGSPG